MEWAASLQLRPFTSALPSASKCLSRVNENATSSTEVFPDPAAGTFPLVVLCPPRRRARNGKRPLFVGFEVEICLFDSTASYTRAVMLRLIIITPVIICST